MTIRDLEPQEIAHAGRDILADRVTELQAERRELQAERRVLERLLDRKNREVVQLNAYINERDDEIGALRQDLDAMTETAFPIAAAQQPSGGEHVTTIKPTVDPAFGAGVLAATWHCSCGAASEYDYLFPPTAEAQAAQHRTAAGAR